MAQRQGSEPRANSKEETVLLLTRQSCKEWRREPSSAQEETEGARGEEQAKEETLGERVDTQGHRQRIETHNEIMANTTAAAPFNFPEAEPLSHMAMQVQEVYPFHDGWNVACFIILLLFILTVISLAALAVLYELLDCGCCAKGKTHLQLQAEGPGSCSRLMSGMCKPPDSQTEIV